MGKNTFVPGLLSLILFLGIVTFSVFFAKAAPTSATFTVNLTISGNAAPTIAWVQTGLSPNPIESANTSFNILFNVSDNNGFADINYSSARVYLLQSGEAQRVSGTCVAYSNNSLVMALNCTMNLRYFDRDGTWTINATVQDLSHSYIENTATTLTYGTLQAMRANLDGLTFGSLTLGATSGASNDPLVLNNTGNQNFSEINVTAYSLIGVSTPSQIINASNIYINASQDNYGNQMNDSRPVKLLNGTLGRDFGSGEFNRNIYFWITVPGTGLSNQNYNSTNLWTVNVYP